MVDYIMKSMNIEFVSAKYCLDANKATGNGVDYKVKYSV